MNSVFSPFTGRFSRTDFARLIFMSSRISDKQRKPAQMRLRAGKPLFTGLSTRPEYSEYSEYSALFAKPFSCAMSVFASFHVSFRVAGLVGLSFRVINGLKTVFSLFSDISNFY